MTDRKASAVIVAKHAAVAGGRATVDVQVLGSLVQGVRYSVWYTPQLGDLVVIDWLGSQPYVSDVFF